MKRLMWIPVLSVVLAFALACGAGDTGPASSTTPRPSPPAGAVQPAQFPANTYMAELQRRGKIVIGVKFDAPPMGRLNPVTNRAEGFDVDIGKEIAKAIFGDENKAEFIEAVSANRIPFLREDKADLIISTMTITEARKQEIDFSDVYYKAGQSILVPRDSTIRDVNDLNGKRVCSAQGSTSEQNVRQRAPQAELVLFAGYAECLTALQSRRVDAISTDDTILAGIAAQDRNTKLTGGIFTEEPYGIGIKKGRPEFVQFVNKVIDDMIKDGRWAASYNRWLGEVTGVSADEALKRFR